jgi:ankyrin repeat protein
MSASTPKNPSESNPTREQVENFLGAAGTGKTAAVKEFLDKYPAYINTRDGGGSTALQQAVYYGPHEDTIALLLVRGIDVNASNNVGKTALQMAASFDHENIVKMLLENGASLDPKDNWHRTALDCAVESKHKGIVTILKQWEKHLAIEQQARELAEEIADFSPALKRAIPASRPLKTPAKGL